MDCRQPIEACLSSRHGYPLCAIQHTSRDRSGSGGSRFTVQSLGSRRHISLRPSTSRVKPNIEKKSASTAPLETNFRQGRCAKLLCLLTPVRELPKMSRFPSSPCWTRRCPMRPIHERTLEPPAGNLWGESTAARLGPAVSPTGSQSPSHSISADVFFPRRVEPGIFPAGTAEAFPLSFLQLS